MLYGNAGAHILGLMDVTDLKEVRLAIVSERERQGLNQKQLALKAGIDQGHLSKIENVDDEPMRDLAARIVFQIIERGLDVSLPSFFAQIKGLQDAKLIDHTVASPEPTKVVDVDGQVPVVSDSDARSFVITTLAELLAEAREGAAGKDRRQAPDPHAQTTDNARHRRTSARRAPSRKKARRRRGRG